MKKIATFTYGVIFALGMSLIALMVIVTIGKYDYKWEYKEELPQISPGYETVSDDTTAGVDTGASSPELLSKLVITEVGGWRYITEYYNFNITINAVEGTSTISYIEYSLYSDTVCQSVHYESFSEPSKQEDARFEQGDTRVWKATVPFASKVTLIRIRLVWTDEEGNAGEYIITTEYPVQSWMG